jgi:hypothetical protein
MSAREFFSDLDVALPGTATSGSVSVRCFANPSAHEHDDKNASCSVNLDTGQWRCFGCGAKGGAFDAALALGRSRSDAAELAKRHDLFVIDREQPNPACPRTAPRLQPLSAIPTGARVAVWHKALIGNEPALVRLLALRGWTPAAIESLELGYDGERITFPIRGADRRLVGMLRYAPNPDARNGPEDARGEGHAAGVVPATGILAARGARVCGGGGA